MTNALSVWWLWAQILALLLCVFRQVTEPFCAAISPPSNGGASGPGLRGLLRQLVPAESSA